MKILVTCGGGFIGSAVLKSYGVDQANGFFYNIRRLLDRHVCVIFSSV